MFSLTPGQVRQLLGAVDLYSPFGRRESAAFPKGHTCSSCSCTRRAYVWESVPAWSPTWFTARAARALGSIFRLLCARRLGAAWFL